MTLVIAALFGWIYASLLEYGVHRFVFHGIGKKRSSVFAFHWHQHHGESRRNKMVEPAYLERKLAWNGYTREVVGITVLLAVHLPLLLLFPTVFLGMLTWALTYHFVHHKSHVDPEWARVHCPWHVDHHMAPNQDANYGVTSDWMDRLFGTREVFVGTDAEQRRVRARGRWTTPSSPSPYAAQRPSSLRAKGTRSPSTCTRSERPPS